MKYVFSRLFQSACAYVLMAFFVFTTTGCFQDAQVTSTGSSFLSLKPTFDDSSDSEVSYNITNLGASSIAIAGDCPSFGQTVNISDGTLDGNGDMIWHTPGTGDYDCTDDDRFSLIAPTFFPNPAFANYLSVVGDTHTFYIRMTTSLGVSTGQGSITVTYQDVNSLAKYWTGLSGDGKWSTATNWSGNTVPLSTEIAVFDNTCTNCNCNVDTYVEVAGIDMRSTYTGVISQGANILKVGTSDFAIDAGTFNANATFELQIVGSLTITGGVFNLAGANVSIARNFTEAGGTFGHSFSHVIFNSANSSVIDPGAASFYDLEISKTAATTVTLLYDVPVINQLILSNSAPGANINNYQFFVGGDVKVMDQGGPGGTEITMNGTTDQFIYHYAGEWPYKINIDKATGLAHLASNVTLTTTDLNIVDGNLLMHSYSLTGIDVFNIVNPTANYLYKGCGTLSYTSSTAGTINQVVVDEYGISLSVANAANVTEGAAQNFVASLSTPNCRGTEVFYQMVDGTAIGNSDYTDAPSSITIPAGQTSYTISVATIDDADDETASENYTLDVTSLEIGIGLGTTTGTGNILDNDAAPIVNFAAATSADDEGIGTHEVEVTLDRVTYLPVTVNYTELAGGTANNGTDFTLAAGLLTFAAGEVSKTISFAYLNDSTIEGDETLFIQITGVSNSSLGAQSTHTATITDNDFPPSIIGLTVNSGDRQYTDGETVSLSVFFDQNVTKVGGGGPRILLNTTPARYADYSGGSGTATWTFNYSVQDGDISADLNYVNATTSLELNGITIKDSATVLVNADLNLGNAPSWSSQYNIIINPRPRIYKASCTYDAFVNEAYTGCQVFAQRHDDTFDTSATFAAGAGGTCAWATVSATGAITGTPTSGDAGHCVVAARVTDAYSTSAIYNVYINVHTSAGIAQIAQSGFHGCAVVEGVAKCWGTNMGRALGNSDLTTTNYLQRVLVRYLGGSSPNVLTGVTRVTTGALSTASSSFSCARLSASGGTVSCWGSNDFGQMSDSSNTTRPNPGTIAGLTNVMSLSSGAAHNCAIVVNASSTLTGKVKCWGKNSSGQLGVGDTTDRLNFVGVLLAGGSTDLTQATSLATGADHSCATIGDGSVRCWGSNNFGQLGIDSTLAQTKATEVIGYGPNYGTTPAHRAVRVFAGNKGTCVISEAGELKCWGANSTGQLGKDDTVTRGQTSTAPYNMANLTAINLGVGRSAHDISMFGDAGTSSGSVCAVLDDNTLKCWGANTIGQLGQESTFNRGDNPGEMTGLAISNLGTGHDAVTVDGGNETACALTSVSGVPYVKCWGRNTVGQTGEQMSGFANFGGLVGDLGDNFVGVDLTANIFASSVTHTGNFNTTFGTFGTGINAFCKNDAFNKGRPDAINVFALVSNPTGTTMNAADLYTTSLRITKTDNLQTPIASTWASLWSGALSSSIDVDAVGAAAPGTAFTGTTSSGVLTAGNNCSNWTSNAPNATYGNIGAVATTWVNAGTNSCATAKRVFCVAP